MRHYTLHTPSGRILKHLTAQDAAAELPRHIHTPRSRAEIARALDAFGMFQATYGRAHCEVTEERHA